MNLGVLLPLGESLTNYSKHGQDIRFLKYYIHQYCQKFDKVYIFSYETESRALPKNCRLVCPKIKVHRYIYGLILPFLQAKYFRQCQVFRCFHPSAAIPAIVGKLLFGTKFIFNYNYDYSAWARIEGKQYLVPLLFIEQWLAFKFCDGVFVADENMQSHVMKYVPGSKVVIVRNGVDTESFKPLRKKTDRKEKVILSVGRLETQKNYQQLIEAASRLKQKVKLLIVGRGSLKQALLGRAGKLGVELEIIDVVPNDKLPQVYNRADVYVQPSLMEAPVKTLLEAMSCGLPCVATDVVGIRDVISDGQNGLLAKLSPNDLAEKLDRILADEKLAKKLGTNARKLVVEKYNLLIYLQVEVDALSAL